MARKESSREGGELIIIGGGEDKRNDCSILRRVSEPAAGDRGKLVIVTAATQVPDEYLEGYMPLFKDLDVRNIEVLDIRSREDAYSRDNADLLDRADVIFFTGGSQLRIASQMGGSPVLEAMMDRHRRGATVAGTSAGAAAMPETMLIAGPSDESPDVEDLSMAPGLGLVRDMVIDTHFAQRGRIGRLLTSVAQNPRMLGLGIDEDTAVVVDGDQNFTVVGSGAVYVVDGRAISYSSFERRSRGVMTVHDVKLHVLADGDRFDWRDRHPLTDRNEDEKAA
jgi:cyanophycinase